MKKLERSNKIRQNKRGREFRSSGDRSSGDSILIISIGAKDKYTVIDLGTLYLIIDMEIIKR